MDLFKPNQPYTPKVSVDITDIAELNRRATAAKGNDWDTALACLFRAKELMENQYQDFPQRLRLPLFLQQAGEFEAAKYEFAYLLENLDRFVELEAVGHQDKRRYKVFVKNLCLERLYDKARVAFKREKLTDASEQCRLLSEQYQEKRIEALEKLTVARKEKIEKHRAEFPISRINDEDDHQTSEIDRNNIIRETGKAESDFKPDAKLSHKQGCFSTAACLVVSIGILTWLIF